MFAHTPVLLTETIALLDPQPGQTFVDCTVGGGSHAAAILERLGPQGRLIGLDRDKAAIAASSRRLAPFGDRFISVQANFAGFAGVLDELGVEWVDGVLADLGVSSPQIDEVERGFTYQAEAPLDMRMDPDQPLAAAELVNRASLAELTRILREYGEERWAVRIARFIVERRERSPLATTADLVAVITAAVPAGARRSGPHPARRTFQALRIAVNDELGALAALLAQAPARLRPGGRMAVISFHSLEDRAVKRTWQELARGCVCPPDFPACRCGRTPLVEILTRRPVRPAPDEVERNPRSKSARLRAVRRVLPAKEPE